MQQKLNLEIMSFVEREILPRYNAFGKSHGLQHVQHVIKNSLELVPLTGADINMVYVIAAYHDVGMEGPRAIHHITGGKILQSDARLRRWFTPEQIKIMKEAVEDHRASSSRPIATLIPIPFSHVPFNMVWKTILRRTVKSSGNAFASI